MDNIENRGYCERRNVKDGVPYIYTSNGMFILPQFWGLYEETEKPEGIALKEDEHGVLVALKDSEQDLVLLGDYKKDVTGKLFDNSKTAKNDWGGKENTDLFIKAGSPAAKFCANYETKTIKKGNWWLPSYAEMELMCRHKNEIDACLSICGAIPIFYGWHWTSTQFSSCSAWVFSWYSGNTLDDCKVGNLRVRPVSAFPDLTL